MTPYDFHRVSLLPNHYPKPIDTDVSNEGCFKKMMCFGVLCKIHDL